MSRFSSLFAGAALLTGLSLATTATAADLPTPQPTDTIQITLADGASMTLFVKDQEQLRKLRAYKMDSLLTLLDRYLTQAQNVSKAAGDAGKTTMEFYPARDLNNPSAPEKLRVVVYNEKGRPATTTTRVNIGRGVTIRVEEDPTNGTTQVAINGKGVHVTDTDEGTKVKIGQQDANEDSLKQVRRQRYDEEHTHGYLSVGFGFNTLANAGRAQVAGDPAGATAPISLRNWGSRYVHIGYMADTRLLRAPASAPFLRYGVQFAFNNYMLEGNRQWVDVNDVTMIAAAADGRSLQKSKLATSTVQLPVLLGFRLHNQKGKEALSVAAGGFAGYRINSRTKIKYDQSGDSKKVKDRGAYNLEDFQYGLMGSVSVFGHELFATYNLNEVFRSNQGPQGNVLAFGVTLMGNEHNMRSDKYRGVKRAPGVAMR